MFNQQPANQPSEQSMQSHPSGQSQSGTQPPIPPEIQGQQGQPQDQFRGSPQMQGTQTQQGPPQIQGPPPIFGEEGQQSPQSESSPQSQDGTTGADFDQAGRQQTSQETYEAASFNIVNYMRLRYSSSGPTSISHLSSYSPPYSVSMTSPEDSLVVDVQNTSYSNWMHVTFKSNLSWRKELQGVGYSGQRSWSIGKQDFNAAPTSRWISSNAASGWNYFTQTMFLRKAKFIGGVSDMYFFDPSSFWNTWGGKQVTITWLKDG